MNKTSNLIKTIVEVGLFAAIAFALDELQGIIFANVFTAGGSIGFAMVAVLIIAFRRGWLPAIFVGLIMGVFDLATKAYIITPWQVLLDYVLPYALVGVAGFYRPWFNKSEKESTRILILILATVSGGLLKFLSHFIVGALIWAPLGYEWAISNGTLYSFAYNIAFVGPSIVICALLLIGIYKRAPQILYVPDVKIEEEKEHKQFKIYDYVINPLLLIGGLFLFIYYFIIWLQSYQTKDKGAYGLKVTFDGDALAIYILGFILVIICVLSLILFIKKKQDYRLSNIALIIMFSSSTVYALAKLLTCYLDSYEDPTKYYIWMFTSFAFTGALIANYILMKKAHLYETKSIEEK